MVTRTKLDILNSRDKKLERMPTPYTGAAVDPNRTDTYAENLIGSGIYKDNGCDLAPACLSCPYSECLKELNSIEDREQRNGRIWREYQRMKNRGKFPVVPVIADKYGLGTRTVHRIVSDAKKGKGLPKRNKVSSRQKPTHELLTAGIFKKRVPLPPLAVSY
tara:strand:+ start:15 stop:500 length:486 start_codon:yes stop_codon:yes gene_type:complete